MPVSIYKPIGQTPNELIEIYKKENKKVVLRDLYVDLKEALIF